jgi:FixJ family two-component response regulator
VDDDDAVRRSLEFLLRGQDMDVRGYVSGEAFFAAFKPVVPACVLVDLRMPEMDGLDLQARLRPSKVPIIFITGHGTVGTAVKAMENGAVSFLEKPYDPEVLLERVRVAHERHSQIAGEAARVGELVQRFLGLTPRQREVLRRVVQGKPNKVIAIELDLSEKTIELHRAKMMRRMGADSLAELVKMWVLLEGHVEQR